MTPFGNLKKVTQKKDEARVLFEKAESAQKAIETLKENPPFSIVLAEGNSKKTDTNSNFIGEAEKKWWSRYLFMNHEKKHRKGDNYRKNNKYNNKKRFDKKKLVQPEAKVSPSKIGPPPAIVKKTE